jgi:hypothetical protein
MKKLFWLALIQLLLVLLAGCGKKSVLDEIPNTAQANYMEHGQLCKCGDTILFCDDHGLNLMKNGIVRSLDPNVVASMSEKAPRTEVIAARDNAIYWLSETYAEQYGEGNGVRIYRYDPKTGDSELVHKDVSISNTDGLLGLEDIFHLPMLTSGHINGDGGYLILEDRVIPGWDILKAIQAEADAQKLDLHLPDDYFSFALTNGNLFFNDASYKLWRFCLANHSFHCLDVDRVLSYFVFDGRLFVIPTYGADIEVFSPEGSRIQAVPVDGFGCSGSLIQDNGVLWLEGESGFLCIDSQLRTRKVNFPLADYRWTIENAILYYYENDTINELVLKPKIG